MGTELRRLRRRAIIVGLGVLALGANAVVPGPSAQRLPYLLAVVTLLFLTQTFWEDRASAGSWLGIGTVVLIAAMAASINFAVNRVQTRQRAETPATTTTAPAADSPSTTAAATTEAVTGSDIPTEVAGAVETRTETERLVACESALEQIAAAIRAAGSEVTDQVTDSGAVDAEPTPGETERRLTSCDVRLQAIAETLPR